jgi:hypothetical protein
VIRLHAFSRAVILGAVRELVLQSLEGEFRAYELPGVGTLRFGKTLYSKTLAESGGRTWTLGRPGVLRPRVTATELQTRVIAIDVRLRRGRGDFTLDGRQLAWTRASGRIRWCLGEGDRELARFDGPEPGRPLVKVTVADDARLAPLVLLLGCFMTLASDQDSSVIEPGPM